MAHPGLSRMRLIATRTVTNAGAFECAHSPARHLRARKGHLVPDEPDVTVPAPARRRAPQSRRREAGKAEAREQGVAGASGDGGVLASSTLPNVPDMAVPEPGGAELSVPTPSEAMATLVEGIPHTGASARNPRAFGPFASAPASARADDMTAGTGGARPPVRRQGRGGRWPVDGPERVPTSRRPGQAPGRPMTERDPNAAGSLRRPMPVPGAPVGTSLGRTMPPGGSGAGFRAIGRSPEDIARLAQEARREARLNRGKLFRAAAIGQSEPYRALGRGPTPAPGSPFGSRLGGAGHPPGRGGPPRIGRPSPGR